MFLIEVCVQILLQYNVNPVCSTAHHLPSAHSLQCPKGFRGGPEIVLVNPTVHSFEFFQYFGHRK